MGTIHAFFRALRTQSQDPTFRAIFGLATALLVLGTVVYTLVEGWSPLDALYFSVVTLATVGYGDLAPRTAIGRGFTIVFILAGVGIIVAFATQVVNAMISDRTERSRIADRHHVGTDVDPGSPPTGRMEAEDPSTAGHSEA